MENQDTIKAYYESGIESDRLNLEIFKWEGLRTKEIINRYLSKPALNILDVGGGAGFYAFWLAALGHQVSLVDLSPKNIELADEYAAKHHLSLKYSGTGDATNLKFADDQFDIVLLLGPLYHLTESNERIKGLSEAKRVLKPGGILLAAVISKYASLVDGLKRELIVDDAFVKLLIQDLHTGRHINTTGNPDYFTTAYFHTPEEIRNEIIQSALNIEKLIAIESVGWIIDGLSEKLKNEKYMQKVQEIIDIVESNDDIIAISPHIMAVARK